MPYSGAETQLGSPDSRHVLLLARFKLTFLCDGGENKDTVSMKDSRITFGLASMS